MDKERIIKTLSDRRFMPWLWVALGVISALCKMKAHNNFDIFRYVFYNTWQGTSLYAPATDGGFWDINHYGSVLLCHYRTVRRCARMARSGAMVHMPCRVPLLGGKQILHGLRGRKRQTYTP